MKKCKVGSSTANTDVNLNAPSPKANHYKKISRKEKQNCLKRIARAARKAEEAQKGQRVRAHTLKNELPSQVRGEEVHLTIKKVTSLLDHQEDCEMDKLRAEDHIKFIEIRKEEPERHKENSVE